MMRIFTTAILVFCTSGSLLFAQKEYNTWFFGHRAGLNFNSGTPVAVNGNAMNADEGSSSISDANGNLLFYTDGITLWDRNNNPMPNGSGLTGDNSSTQSALIVKQPGSSHLYYVFTTFSTLNYSIVDMNLNGGLGDVVPGSKNILLISNAGEKLCGTHDINGVDYWIVSHEYSSDGFNSFLLTSTGLNTTARHSNTGTTNSQNGAYGQMKISPQGNRIAFGIADQSPPYANITLTVADFDNGSGIACGGFSLKTDLFQTYGVEFSPSGRYLYGCINYAVTQYDLYAGSQAAVQASADTIATSNSYPFDGMQLGPDGKIYCAMGGNSFVSVINEPDKKGTACNFTLNSVSLGGNTVGLDFPSIIIFDTTYKASSNLEASFSHTDVTCHDSCNGSITVHVAGGSPPFFIQNGVYNDSIITINNFCPGPQNISITDLSCHSYNSSFTFTNPPATPLNIQAERNIFCPHDSVKLTATSGFVSYQWFPTGNKSSIEATLPGNYYVTAVNSAGCAIVSGVQSLSLYQRPSVVITADSTKFCTGDSVHICATAGFINYQWNNGTGNGNCIYGKQSGTYNVTVTDNHACEAPSNNIFIPTGSASVVLQTDKNAFCANDSLELCIADTFAGYHWSSGATGPCIQAKTAGDYSVTVTTGKGCSAHSNKVTLSVYTVQPVTIKADTNIFCANDSVRICTTTNYSSYQWNNGSNTGCTEAKEAGNYYVTATDNNGCTAESNHLGISIYPVSSVSIVKVGDTLSSVGAVHYQWYQDEQLIPNAISPVYIANEAGNFSVAITDSNGCVATSSPVSVTTGVRELDRERVTLYPNPTVDGWQLTVDSKYIGDQLEIFDAGGQKVFQSKISNLHSAIELNIAAGIYWLRISSPDVTILRKLVKL